MAYRLIKGAAGRTRVQLIANKCKFKVNAHELCLEPVRLEPGAIYCFRHKDLENAGCAAHDRLNCKEVGCK